MDTASLQAPETFLAVRRARLAALRDSLQAIFPVNLPVVLEVGCGHGHYLAAFAAAHSDLFCVGLDRNASRIRRAEKKRETAGLKNLRFIRCDIHDFLQCVAPGVRFAAIIALFPDPWPKKRHCKNRLIQPPFLDALAARMEPGGRFFFRTDHRPYYMFAEHLFSTHARWTVRPDAAWIFEADTVFQAKAPYYQSLVAEHKHTVL